MRNKKIIFLKKIRQNQKWPKKAQIFTVIAILLIGLMFLSFEVFSFFGQRSAVKTRISTMESFLESIEENLERQVFISGFRIIFLAEDQITSTGNYVWDIDAFFDEAFFDGTVNGEANSSILLGATFNDLNQSLNDKAKKINVEIIIKNPNITLSQADPWNVNFTLSVDFLMKDKEGLAQWDKRQVVSGLIPVENFEDPVFTVETIGKVSRKINQTIYEGNYASGVDVTNLADHVDKRYYAANADAPSFLMRLEGDLTADSTGNGIETFVNIPELSAEGVPTLDKSVVDHIYFSSSNPSSTTISGMPSWFEIDTDHRTKYQV